MPVRAAVWDLGSSSFHLLVCEAGEDGSLHPVLRRRALLNLGAAVGATGTIPADRIAAALSATRRMRRQLEAIDADVVVVLATAALRDARNGGELVERLERVVGAPVRVLDGAEEARLCFLGQRAGVWMPDAPSVGIDLGGGSLEVAVGTMRTISLATSVPVGATRLRGQLGTGDVLGPEDRSMIRRLTETALREVHGAMHRLVPAPGRAILSGGTARALGRMATARTRARGESSAVDVNQVELPAGQVAEMADMLAALPLEERLRLPGMPARRAPVLPLGAAILASAAPVLDIERFVVSEWGLREGALLDALSSS